MKIVKISLALLLTLFILPSFGEDVPKDKGLFDFSAATPVVPEIPKVETPKVVEKKETVDIKTEVKTETKTEVKTEIVTPAALVADAQTLIKDKLVQKYQVRLDEVIGRMTSRLSSLSAEEQRIALTDLRDRMVEKKNFVIDKKDLEPLKRDIIITILDHVVYRLEGIIKQSAHTSTDKVQA